VGAAVACAVGAAVWALLAHPEKARIDTTTTAMALVIFMAFPFEI
jgi:predicted metal-dependent phosphoesterase TrpH